MALQNMKFRVENEIDTIEINKELTRLGYFTYPFEPIYSVKSMYAYLDGDVTYDDSCGKYFENHTHTETTLEELKAM